MVDFLQEISVWVVDLIRCRSCPMVDLTIGWGNTDSLSRSFRETCRLGRIDCRLATGLVNINLFRAKNLQSPVRAKLGTLEGQAMWICSKCEARVEPDFDVCWRCGTTYQGEEDPDFVTADETPPIEDPTDYLRLEAGKLPEEELPSPPLELVGCFQGVDVAEAKFVSDLLAAEGIPSALENTARPGTHAGGSLTLYPCRVMIKTEDLPRARPIIEEFVERKRSREARDR